MPDASPITANPPETLPALLPTEPEQIFIVGSSRSGTSLMRHLLERSPRIAIARENHFLGHLRKTEGARFYFRRVGDLADDETMRKMVKLIYSGEFQRQSRWREVSTFWKKLVETVPQDEMEARLLAAERTERGLFIAFLRSYSDRLGRPIYGEKTPAHLAYVDTLFEWFPRAKVVHMVRDPRAVFVSDLRRRRGKLRRPYSWFGRIPGLLPLVIMIQTTLVWRAAIGRHAKLVGRYPDRYRMVRFEDLVRDPDTTLKALYEFLGVEMPSDATEVQVVSSGFSKGQHGLDADAADRWKSQIGGFARRWLQLSLRGPMRQVGYGTDSH